MKLITYYNKLTPEQKSQLVTYRDNEIQFTRQIFYEWRDSLTLPISTRLHIILYFRAGDYLCSPNKITKETFLSIYGAGVSTWNELNKPELNIVKPEIPVLDSKIHPGGLSVDYLNKYRFYRVHHLPHKDRKPYREKTPPGFATAFYNANP